MHVAAHRASGIRGKGNKMQVSIKQIVDISFCAERLNIARQALYYGLGDKYESADVTIDDVRFASPKIEEKLNELCEKALNTHTNFIGDPISDDEKMRMITIICETGDRIRSVFAALSS